MKTNTLNIKKYFYFLTLFILCSCATATGGDDDEAEVVPPEDRIVKFVFTTQEPNYDEVHVSYYDYKTDSHLVEILPFSYDNAGNALPLELVLENYDFRYIDGEGYRNNHSTAELAVQVFVNDKMVVEDSDKGTSSRYARVLFNYDIVAGN